MKLYLSDPLLDKQIGDIRRKIRLSMNGVVSEQMTLRGAAYRQNYGVSVARLRELARLYEPNHDLAQRLWLLGIRETMILATLLEPADRFTPADALRMAADFNQTELVEQACMNLFARMPRAPELCMRLLQSDEPWLLVTGFTLAARIAGRLSTGEVRQVVDRGVECSATDRFALYHAIALGFSWLCRTSAGTARLIAAAIDPLRHSDEPGRRYIVHEVSEEMSFLDFL